jgi:hypothetical protein
MYILAWGIDVSSPLVGYWGFSIKIRKHDANIIYLKKTQKKKKIQYVIISNKYIT